MIKDLSDLSSTYMVAKTYSIDDLCDRLLEYADKELQSIYTSTLVYDQYLRLGDLASSRLDEALAIINVHAYLAFLHPSFTEISKSTLIKLLQSDQLFIREKDIYYASIRWIRAELARNRLEENFENKLTLFNSIMHLIRFPIMTEHQFFRATRERRFAYEPIFELCPARSALFDENELKEFDKYFRTKSTENASWPTSLYNSNRRGRMNIGSLDLTGSYEEHLEFRMNTEIDDSFYCGHATAESYYSPDGNSESVYTVDYEEIKSKQITLEDRRNSLVCKTDSIRIFRIHVNGMSSRWVEGNRILIKNSGTCLISFHYR